MLLKSSSELSESEWGRGQRSKDGNKGIRTKNDYTQISFLGGCLTVCLSCTSLRWNHQEKWKLVFSFIWALSLNPEAPSLQSHLSPAESRQLLLPVVSPGCEHLGTHSKALMKAKPTFCTHYLIIFSTYRWQINGSAHWCWLWRDVQAEVPDCHPHGPLPVSVTSHRATGGCVWCPARNK